jgi:distribution and morphology protein 31
MIKMISCSLLSRNFPDQHLVCTLSIYSIFLPQFQDVMINMSANLGRRLYAHIWDTANPFLGRIRINRISPDASSRTLRDGLLSNHSRRISTLPRKQSHLTRKFASGSFFVLGVSPTLTTAETTAACILPSRKIAAQYLWKRSIHTPNDDRRGKEAQGAQVRNENDHSPKLSQPGKDTSTHSQTDPSPSQHSKHQTPPNRPLMDRLPHMPHLHRPTKEELLAAATGFWSRLKVRFKWFSIRSVRPFSLDEIAALFSWVLLGHIVWVVVGTTTFFSLLILAINTVFAQGKLYKYV